MSSMLSNAIRKIIHIDMDCFYAAVEIRDNPSLADKPVAVGGSAEDRSVLCTCNYIARKFKVRSAMATAYAKRLCPDLIILPVNIQKYREVSEIIRAIFLEFTPLVEPLSLDEAYLDVTNSPHYQGSATLIANAIRQKIFDTVHLTASAGVSTNKLLAKIASSWKKPNGLFVIRPENIDTFMKNLPVDELYGVGKMTAKKLHELGLKTCSALQAMSLIELINHFSEKRGYRLYEQCRGIDNRQVEPNRIRKSLSVEQTFKNDIVMDSQCLVILHELYDSLLAKLKRHSENRPIKNQCIKIKLSDFKIVTLERSSQTVDFSLYENILFELIGRSYGKIRLMGVGVHFSE
ncbi:MAG: DNA polymerase IV [Gammaproteobacteria bacterium]|nr:DNA polymerase IV [Gammaproteobacteria bacterium]MCW5583847.1 DNA polymerase IV [Gammaproteobacteria bacterium]